MGRNPLQRRRVYCLEYCLNVLIGRNPLQRRRVYCLEYCLEVRQRPGVGNTFTPGKRMKSTLEYLFIDFTNVLIIKVIGNL